MNIFSQRLNFISRSEKVEFDISLSGLRGILALVVFFDHALQNEHLSLGWTVPYLNFGPSAVLCFFCLSGYVIGLGAKKVYGRAEVRKYVGSRLIRIVPIYICAVCLGCLAAGICGQWPPLVDVVGNFFFLQGFFVNTISANEPLWSLSYEMFYYGAFIVIWKFSPTIKTILLGILVTLICSYCFGEKFASLMLGAYFWIGGFLIAHFLPVHWKRQSPWGVLLIIALIHHYQPGVILFRALGVIDLLHSGWVISPAQLMQLLPVTLLLIGGVTGRLNNCLRRCLLFISWLTALTGIILTAKVSGFDSHQYMIPLALLVLSLPLSGQLKTFLMGLRKISFLGDVSYALYVLHFPIFIILGTLLSIDNRLLVFCLASVIILASSYLLERIIQPKISVFFKSRL